MLDTLHRSTLAKAGGQAFFMDPRIREEDPGRGARRTSGRWRTMEEASGWQVEKRGGL